MKKLILVVLLTGLLYGQTKYFSPIPIENSAGTPIRSAVVVAYPAGTTSNGITLTYLSGSRYYTTTAVANQYYDFYIAGVLYITNILWGTGITISGTGISVSPDTTSAKLVISDTLLYLAELSSGLGVGSGMLVRKDASFGTANGISMWDRSDGALWVRQEFVTNPKVLYSTWSGAVDDGTDQTTEINNLFNAAMTVNAEVILTDMYYTASTTWTLTSPIQITGEDTTCGLRGDYNSLDYANQTGASIWIQSNDVTLKDFTLDSTVVVLDSTISNILIDHLIIQNYTVLGGEAGGIFSDQGSNPGTEKFDDVVIKNCILQDFVDTGGIVLQPTIGVGQRNITIIYNTIRNGVDTSSSTNYYCGARGTVSDSGIIISFNKIYNISSIGRAIGIYAVGTPLVVTGNEIYNITSTISGSNEFDGIRGASKNYIVSHNLFHNITNGSGLISMKSDGNSGSVPANGIVSNNTSFDILNMKTMLITMGPTIVNANIFKGYFRSTILSFAGTDEASDPVGSINRIDTTVVSNNIFHNHRRRTPGPQNGYHVLATIGDYKFNDNDWLLKDAGIFGQTQPTRDTLTTILLQNEYFNLDSVSFFGASSTKMQDSLKLTVKDSEFHLTNYAGADSWFDGDVGSHRSPEPVRFIDTDIYVSATVDLTGDSDALFVVAGAMEFYDVRIHMKGDVENIFLMATTSEIFRWRYGFVDLKEATDTHKIFLWNSTAGGDSVYLSYINISPKAKVTDLCYMNGGASADVFKLLDIRHCSIEAAEISRVIDSADSLTVFNLFNNDLDYTSIEAGSGGIVTFNHLSNSIVGAGPGAGQHLYRSNVTSLSGTSTNITHGIYGEPDSTKFSLMPLSSLGVSSMWVTSFEGAQFTVNTDSTFGGDVVWSFWE